jgi:hypothetical protein
VAIGYIGMYNFFNFWLQLDPGMILDP